MHCDFIVRAARCDHRASQREVDDAIRRTTEPLERSWRKLEAARRIAIKVNLVQTPERLGCVDGRRQELVDESVLKAVLRLLRERTRADVVVVDSTFYPDDPGRDVHFLPLLADFGVEYVECTRGGLAWLAVPCGGLMFRQYQMNPLFIEADSVISIATLKSHAFMGITLTTKNLFGLCPVHAPNRPRGYFHHFIRLPYVLADLGRLLDPCLNIVDGLVAQSGREWGGQARVCDLLVAGDNCIATDACAAHLMGNDPLLDWPTPPFRRDRNHLRIASESGFGTVDLAQIDFEHELRPPVGEFDSDATDPPDVVMSWRRTTCEQALYFAERREQFQRDYAGEYIYLQEGEVVWHGPERPPHLSRRQLSGGRKDSALWLKYVDPEELEGEHFEVYERELTRIGA